ncbi:MAG: hypothetical protein HUU23_10880 [Caldilineales bacterium]|nr:hypothetical protein [Caldilineales bacterium]
MRRLPILSTLRRRLEQEQGSALAYFVISLTVLLGFAALLLDLGIGFLERRHMQNGADAAALAGARVLALGGNTTAINTEVARLATANGVSDYSWSLIDGGNGVQVRADTTFDTWFARVFGLNAIATGATGAATLAAVVETGNLLPMTTSCQAFTYQASYRMWASEDMESPGNFGWLDWDGRPVGNSELASNIANPAQSGSWSINQWIPSGPGVQGSSQVEAALSTWIGRHVTIPLYDTVIGTGSGTEYRICGFGQFVLTGFNFQGSDKWVEGYFIRHILPGARSGNGPDYGVRTVRITQ